MSTFHTTMNRRDFMKTLGVGGAGIGLATAVTPAIHDLDEMISSPQADWVRPWYTREVDQPTIDIDWTKISRYDQRNCSDTSPTVTTPEQIAAETEQFHRKTKDYLTKGNVPGLTLKDMALSDASTWLFKSGVVPSFILKNSYVRGPGYYNLPKWNGTPEENARIVRSALRFFGASTVAFAQLDEKTKKLIFSHDTKGVPYVFEDVDTAYEEANKKRVLPNKYTSVIVYTMRMPEVTMRYGRYAGEQTLLGESGTWMAYSRAHSGEGYLQSFLQGLGYQGLGGGTPAFAPSSSFSVLSGLGEIGRTSYTLTPEHGPMVRSCCRVITDLPLAPTNPIDAGINQFCYTCKKCADLCPSGSISTEDPTWDPIGGYNQGGYLAWRNDYKKCLPYRGKSGSPPNTPIRGLFPAQCCNCMQVCVFNKDFQSNIHEVVKGAISKTSLFNGFFREMDDLFSYGMKDKNPEEWWSNSNQPIMGLDPGREQHFT